MLGIFSDVSRWKGAEKMKGVKFRAVRHVKRRRPRHSPSPATQRSSDRTMRGRERLERERDGKQQVVVCEPATLLQYREKTGERERGMSNVLL